MGGLYACELRIKKLIRPLPEYIGKHVMTSRGEKSSVLNQHLFPSVKPLISLQPFLFPTLLHFMFNTNSSFHFMSMFIRYKEFSVFLFQPANVHSMPQILNPGLTESFCLSLRKLQNDFILRFKTKTIA